MTFIPKKIRLLPLSVALMTALSFSSGVFAATTFQTSYTVGTNVVTVKSEVSANVDVGGKQVTYLVNRKPEVGVPIAATDIIYIDQKAAETDGSVFFQFTTPTTNLDLNTSITFGSETGTAITKDLTNGVKPNDVLFWPLLPRLVTASDTVTKSITGTSWSNYLRMFGTVTNSGSSDKYGILFSRTAGEIDKIDTYSKINALGTDKAAIVQKFPALGKNTNNQFSIELVNSGSGFLNAGKKCYVRTYATYNDGTTDVVVFNTAVKEITL